MISVICKRGEVKARRVEAEIKVGTDHLLVGVDAKSCTECGEAYYPPEAMRRLEQAREDFTHKAISPPGVRTVYQLT